VAHHKSAIKRIRQTIDRTERNCSGRSAVKTAIRKFREACASNSVSDDLASKTIKAVSKAGSKGLIPAKRASRKISRLMKAANRAKANV